MVVCVAGLICRATQRLASNDSLPRQRIRHLNAVVVWSPVTVPSVSLSTALRSA
jgi:hypothetical protein